MLALIAAATFSLSAMQQVVNLSNATISPDGTRVAFVASRVDLDHNRYDDTLQLYDRATSAMRVLSGGHVAIGNLAWSSDGTRLAAVMDDTRSGTQRLYVIGPGNAQTLLTRGDEGVVQIAWDPRGTRIAFTRKDSAEHKTGAAAYEDAFRVGDDAYLDTEEARPYEIWTVDLSGKERRVTHGPLSVMNSPLSWSPDGRYIVCERAPAVHGLHPLATAWRVEVSTGAASQLNGHRRDVDGALFSPNGHFIAYTFTHSDDPADQPEAWLQNADGTGDRNVSQALDRFVYTVAWMPNSDELLLQIDDRTRSPLLVQPLAGPARPLPLGNVAVASIDPQGGVARDGTIAFIGDEPRHPDELYGLSPHATAPTRLTSFNDATARLRLGRVARVSWRSPEGYEEDGVVTYPPDFKKGRRYPLVLRIHGGPYESSTTGFSAFYQLAASHGYVVFAPNYRGSTDLGNQYLHAIFNDPSTGPGHDIMDGIAAVERLGIVDQSRIAISGWSYGGQLTSWLEGHYQIWRAAVAGAAVNDLVVDYSIADDIDASRIMFSGPSPYRDDALALWREQSPITYYQDIRTPTLILCNVYDVRVPIVESYEMFHALRDNGIPVEFYAYPSGGHLPQGPVREADAYRRWLSWFDRYLR